MWSKSRQDFKVFKTGSFLHNKTSSHSCNKLHCSTFVTFPYTTTLILRYWKKIILTANESRHNRHCTGKGRLIHFMVLAWTLNKRIHMIRNIEHSTKNLSEIAFVHSANSFYRSLVIYVHRCNYINFLIRFFHGMIGNKRSM